MLCRLTPLVVVHYLGVMKTDARVVYNTCGADMFVVSSQKQRRYALVKDNMDMTGIKVI